MSQRNSLTMKRVRKAQREEHRKHGQAPGYVLVSQSIIKRHRYLRRNGLPHSADMANLFQLKGVLP